MSLPSSISFSNALSVISAASRYVTFSSGPSVPTPTNPSIPFTMYDVPRHSMHPLVMMIELGFLWDYNSSTKIKIEEFHIYFQPQGMSTTLDRKARGISRNHLKHLDPFVTAALLLFPPTDNQLRRIYARAIKGLETLMKVYASDEDEDLNETINSMKQKIFEALSLSDADLALRCQDPYHESLKKLLKEENDKLTEEQITALAAKIFKLKPISIEESFAARIKNIFDTAVIQELDH